LATGANINPEKKYPSMFEPVHGSAPDIAGQDIANPLAAIWSVSQMLDYFEEERWGKVVLETIISILNDKDRLTTDLGGKALTSEVGDHYVKLLEKNYKNFKGE